MSRRGDQATCGENEGKGLLKKISRMAERRMVSSGLEGVDLDFQSIPRKNGRRAHSPKST